MNDDKKTHGNDAGNGNQESKLDKWIKQNLLGEHNPEAKIVHEPAPKVVHHNLAQNKPAQAKHAHGADQKHAATPQKPQKKGGFFFGRRNKKDAPAHGTSAPAHKPTGAPSHGTGTQGSHGTSTPHAPAHGAHHSAHGAPHGGHRTSHTTQTSHTSQPLIQRGPFPPQKFVGKLRIIALGGLDEVGKNCMVLEYGNDIILIDLGFQFPDADMLGVDYVIPDLTYLQDKMDRVRGIIFTHGHLDHIGAVPYLMQKMNFPVMYGTRLTMGLIEKRLEEFGFLKQSKIKNITADDTLQLGAFNISFFRVNHSIPDAVGVVVKTPAGNIVHTGDFKFDFTPSGDQKPADFARIAGLAGQNIGALFIDSTNALKPGYTISEKKIGDSLEHIIKSIETRIIIASFASQIGRMQQIINYAKKHGRTIFLSGRSLIDNVFMASKLGYLKIPEGLVHDIRKAKKLPENKVLILTTGSQGEDVSALTRMATEEHPAIKIKKGDTVVLSSSPIPGNERAITSVTNKLSRLGARIINNQIMDVHTSGHAQQEDLKLMMSLVKPGYVVPIHGEYHMRFGNKEVAMGIGYDEAHTVMIENGDVIEIENNEVKNKGEKIVCNYVLIDGLGVGDISGQVIMDRQILAENGVLIVMIPVDEKSGKLKGEVDIISRGFIYMKESEELIKSIIQIAADSYRNIMEKRSDIKRAEVKNYLRETIDKFVHQKIERHPLIIPLIVEK